MPRKASITVPNPPQLGAEQPPQSGTAAAAAAAAVLTPAAASTSERAAVPGDEKLEAQAETLSMSPDSRRISIRFGSGDMNPPSKSMCTHLGEQIEKIAVLGSGHFGTVFLVRHGPADTLSLSPLSSKNLRALKMMSKAKNEVRTSSAQPVCCLRSGMSLRCRQNTRSRNVHS
jgi:hypothetical protein